MRHGRERGRGLSDMLLTAEAYGRRVGLRVTAGDLEAVRPWLPHWWVDTDAKPEKIWDLRSAASAELVISDLELWVAEHAVDLVFVHAGVVAIDGRALLLPGRSFTGKTSLTAALLRAGASYGSDEYAVFSADGLVHPYPRPLAMRDNGLRRRVPAADLGADSFTGPLPVAAVAVLRYAAASHYDVHPITLGTSVLRLLDNTVCATTRPEAALATFISAIGNAHAVEGQRGDADHALRPLRQLLR
jgi:hypothetical protein